MTPISQPDVSTGTPFDPDGRLTFDAALHAYAVDGRPLISVTQAIKESLSGTLDEEYWTDEARLRGSYVHEAILYHSQGDLDESTLDPIVQPYFAGYLKFLAQYQPDIRHIETRVFDEAASYAGTFDLVCQLSTHAPNTIDLIDVKSGMVPWWVRLQLAGYRRLVQRVYPNHHICPWALHLREDGTSRLVPVWVGHVTLSNRRDEQDFLSILRTAHLRRIQE
jgi:hypothetical protein